MCKIEIPELSKEDLVDLSIRIKVIITRNGGKFYLLVKEIDEPFDMDKDEILARATGLEYISTITTYHYFGDATHFEPTVHEVLAQIPKEILEDVQAFEIVEYPKKAEDLSENRAAFNSGCHAAKVQLYK